MDRQQWKAIGGWTVAAVAVVVGLGVGTHYLYPQTPPETPGYIVEGTAGGASAPAAAPEQPIEVYLAKADVAKGQTIFKKCAACHNIQNGGPNGMGPNLWGILGLHHAHRADFNYSDAMKATSDKIWTWDTLSQWVKDPKAYIPGNKMGFAGIKDPQDRADVLVYLNSQSDNPQPLPPVPAADTSSADTSAAGDTSGTAASTGAAAATDATSATTADGAKAPAAA